MKTDRFKKAVHLAQYLPIAGLLAVGRLLPFDARGWLSGTIVGWGTRWLPPFRKRIERGLDRVYPDMPKAERNRLATEVGRNTGRTLSEILHNGEFSRKLDRFHASGPGLQALEQAKADGKGAIIVSAHFGQWEAIRHVLKSRGMETGAVYRENSNPYYEKHFLNGILQGGAPIVAKGRKGTMDMVRHVRKGGFFAILPDQYVHGAANLPLMGHEAGTALGPADLALKYGVPLVPAFGLRRENRRDIDVEFEPEIPHSTSEEMMAEYNDRLSARIRQNPGQWYWLHHRWKRF